MPQLVKLNMTDTKQFLDILVLQSHLTGSATAPHQYIANSHGIFLLFADQGHTYIKEV